MENTENPPAPQKAKEIFNPTDELMVAYGFLSEMSDLSNYIYETYGTVRTKRVLFDKVNKETNKVYTKKIPKDKLDNYEDAPAFSRTAMGPFDLHLTELGDMMIKLQMRLKAIIDVNAKNRISERPQANPEMGKEVQDINQMSVVTEEE